MKRICLFTLVLIFTVSFISAQSTESTDALELTELPEPHESWESFTIPEPFVFTESWEPPKSWEQPEPWEPYTPAESFELTESPEPPESEESSKPWESWEIADVVRPPKIPKSYKAYCDFTIGVMFGLLHGESEEIVYYDSNSKLRLSQLNWDIKPLFYAGVEFNFICHPITKIGFFYNLTAKVGISKKTGSMEDRDWAINLSVDDIINTYPHWLNYYSEHDNRTKSALLADMDIGMSYRLKSGFILNFFLSYGFMHFSWEAYGGSFLYPSNQHNFWPSSEKIMTYQQTWHILSPGVSFYGEFNKFFNTELSFKITPLTWLFAKDDHIKRDDIGIFYDSPNMGLFLEPAFRFTFRAGSYVDLCFSYSYRFITGLRGDEMVDNVVYKNTSGAAYSAHDVGITVKIFL